MNIYYDIHSITSELKRRWETLERDDHEEMEKILNDDILSELILFLIKISEKFNNINNRFTIIYQESKNIKDFPIHHEYISEQSYIRFSKKIALNEVALQKIVQTLDYRSTYIAIEYDERIGLCIWGLLNIGHSYSMFERGEVSSTSMPPINLTILCEGNSSLKFTRGGYSLFEIRDGNILAPTGYFYSFQPILDFFKGSLDKFNKEVTGSRNSESNNRKTSYDSDNYSDFMSIIEKIARFTSAKGKSGLLTFIQENDENSNNERLEGIKFNYEIDYDKIWHTLIKSNHISTAYYDKHDIFRNKQESINSDEFSSYSRLEWDKKEIELMLNDNISFVSNLFNSENKAVLLTSRYRIIGFDGMPINIDPAPFQLRIMSGIREKYFSDINIEIFDELTKNALNICSKNKHCMIVIIRENSRFDILQHYSNMLYLWKNIE